MNSLMINMIKNWSADSRGCNKRCSAAFMVLAATLMLCTEFSLAQTIDMGGKEVIDPKERISGGARVGINFFDAETKFDPNAVFVYFDVEPSGHIETQLTTVDGRYTFTAKNDDNNNWPSLKDRWVRLDLQNENGTDSRPLNAEFLSDNYNQLEPDSEIAILVTDKSGRAFPARWGCDGEIEKLRIRVNAEGADAYFIEFDRPQKGEPKGKLVKCEEASKNSQFKFDHNCDMSLLDVRDLAQNSDKQGEIQIIRKRGATYESPIPIVVAIPKRETCDRI